MEKQVNRARLLVSAAFSSQAQHVRKRPPWHVRRRVSRSAMPISPISRSQHASPIVATVHDATRFKGADAQGVAAGSTRFYVEGDVDALIAGPGEIPARVSWLVDLPDTARRIARRSSQAAS